MTYAHAQLGHSLIFICFTAVDEVNTQAKKKKTKYNKTRNKKGNKSQSQPFTSNAPPGIEVNTQRRQPRSMCVIELFNF